LDASVKRIAIKETDLAGKILSSDVRDPKRVKLSSIAMKNCP